MWWIDRKICYRQRWRLLFNERCDRCDSFNLLEVNLFLRSYCLTRPPAAELRFQFLHLSLGGYKQQLQTNYYSSSNKNICVLESSFLYLSFEPPHLLLLPFITTFPFFSCKFLIDAYNILNSFGSEKLIKSKHSVCKLIYA